MTTDTDNHDKPIILPWRVVIDTAEQQPYTFQGLRGDADRDNRPLIVETVTRCLGRHPDSLGDYSLESVRGDWSAIGRCHVERKSIEDAQSTILGFSDGHRERFESELANLGKCEAAFVVVEGTFEDLIRLAPAYGMRTAAQNAKILCRSVLAMPVEYRVPWLFAGSRRMAEICVFRFLERFWRKTGAERRILKKGSIEDGDGTCDSGSGF